MLEMGDCTRKLESTKVVSLNSNVNLTCLNVECSFCEVTGAAFSREKQYQMVIFYATTTIKKIFYS
jgi:hypothetical protein